MANVNIKVENYNNFSAFIKALNKPANEAMTGYTSSTDVSDSRTKFTGTENIEEAYSLLSNGYTEPLDKLKKGLSDFKIKKSDKKQHKPYADVIGFMPIVPHVINGIPQNMINYKQIVNKTKTISILYDGGVTSSVKAEDIINNSIKLLSLINDLEAKGYKTELKWCFLSEGGGKYIAPVIKLKDYKTPLNLARISFPLIHPSMLRRLIFRWIETSAHTTRAWRGGYGRPCAKNPKECKLLTQELKRLGILKDSDIFINYYQLSDDSYKEVIKEYK